MVQRQWRPKLPKVGSARYLLEAGRIRPGRCSCFAGRYILVGVLVGAQVAGSKRLKGAIDSGGSVISI